jgi:hypothetical protein
MIVLAPKPPALAGGIVTSPLSLRIYATRSFKEHNGYVEVTGEKFDVTEDVMAAIQQLEQEKGGKAKTDGWKVLALDRSELIAKQKVLLESAYHALRSYQYGNGSTELAKSVADAIKEKFPEAAKF